MTTPPPIYLICGHGIEIPTPFEKRPIVPEGCCVVLFTTADNAIHIEHTERGTRFMECFSKEAYRTILQDPVAHRRKIKNMFSYSKATGKDATSIRIYKAGDYLPNVSVSPELTWTNPIKKPFIQHMTGPWEEDSDIIASKLQVTKSGMYAFPHIPPLDAMSIKQAFDTMYLKGDYSDAFKKDYLFKIKSFPYFAQFNIRIPSEKNSLEVFQSMGIYAIQDEVFKGSLLDAPVEIFLAKKTIEDHTILFPTFQKENNDSNDRNDLPIVDPFIMDYLKDQKGIFYFLSCRVLSTSNDHPVSKKMRRAFFNIYTRVKTIAHQTMIHGPQEHRSMSHSLSQSRPILHYYPLFKDRVSSHIYDCLLRLNFHQHQNIDKQIDIVPYWNDLMDVVDFMKKHLATESYPEWASIVNQIENINRKKPYMLYPSQQKHANTKSDEQQLKHRMRVRLHRSKSDKGFENIIIKKSQKATG